MSKFQNQHDKFFRRPFSNDITYEEVVIFLESYGFVPRKRDSGSSHTIFEHSNGQTICVASTSGKGILACYIKNICIIIQQMEEN